MLKKASNLFYKFSKNASFVKPIAVATPLYVPTTSYNFSVFNYSADFSSSLIYRPSYKFSCKKKFNTLSYVHLHAFIRKTRVTNSYFYSTCIAYPSHDKVAMPALSPTME